MNMSFELVCKDRRAIISFPNDKILDSQKKKLKAFGEEKLNVVKKMIDRVENIAGKEENAGYQHFLLFPQCFFQSLPLQGR